MSLKVEDRHGSSNTSQNAAWSQTQHGSQTQAAAGEPGDSSKSSPADDILQSSASTQTPAPPQVAPLEAKDLQLVTFSLRVSE